MRLLFLIIYLLGTLNLFSQSLAKEMRLPESIDFYYLKCRLDTVYTGEPEQLARKAFDEGLNGYVVKNAKQHEATAKNYGVFPIDEKTRAIYQPTLQTDKPYVSIIFNRERNDRFAKEAIIDGRVLEACEGKLYGKAKWLSKFLDNALDIRTSLLNKNKLRVEIRNNSSFTYELIVKRCKELSLDETIVTIAPFGISYFTLSGEIIQPNYQLEMEVTNVLTSLSTPLVYNRDIKGMPYAATALDSERYPIIPAPTRLVAHEGEFVITPTTRLVLADREAEKVADFLTDPVKRVCGIQLKRSKKSVDNTIVFATSQDTTLGKEGYRLNVTKNRITLEAQTTNGFFYGIQSLLQLLPPQIYSLHREYEVKKWNVPAVEIYDVPRFEYRGLHLDVGRHLFSIEFIKKYIDLLSMQKMNKFHWHLTEDQGWRIEIKKYPELTQIGSMRKETIANRYNAAGGGIFDGKPYGGYYTQDQIKEIVAYAAARQVEVIPEIDLPGHMLAVLATYPDLGCTGGPYEVGTRWGIYDDVLCAGNDKIYTFIEDVLKEVFELFPSQLVHIGGDECPKVRWKNCPKCQAKIKAENLKNEYELQSYVIHRVEKFLNQNGKKLIGWDEILEGGIAPNATLMSWRGVEAGIIAAKSGHDVIMTPNTHVYLDHYQTTDHYDVLSNGRVASLEWTYGYEPIAAELTEKEAKNIKGVQANAWTEYIRTTDMVEHMVFPRATAAAEIGWTPATRKDWKDFLNRMQVQFERWRYWGVNYAPHYEKIR